MSKTTPEQSFANYFNMANDEAAAQNERDKAEKAMAAWLKRHGKTRRDIGAILLQAEKDDQKRNPPPPPPDPRAGTPHPYSGRKFSPADVVEHVIKRYVTMAEQAGTMAEQAGTMAEQVETMAEQAALAPLARCGASSRTSTSALRSRRAWR